MGLMMAVRITKDEVLNKNIQTIYERMKEEGSNELNRTIQRNTWEVAFEGYDDDPREIFQIEEIREWICKSVDEGLPWFYFVRTPDHVPTILVGLLTCYALVVNDDGTMAISNERIKQFIDKNLHNLREFCEEYKIPDELEHEATDASMGFITSLLSGTIKKNN